VRNSIVGYLHQSKAKTIIINIYIFFISRRRNYLKVSFLQTKTENAPLKASLVPLALIWLRVQLSHQARFIQNYA